jgi:uncharacterized protein
VKILTISDKVENILYSERVAARFGDVDLVLSCGDLPLYYLEYIVTMLNAPLYFVFGNHGEGAEANGPNAPAIEPAGCVNVDGRVINHKGLLIAGLEGSLRYNNRGRFQHSEAEINERIARMWPRLMYNRLKHGRYLDILITHAPPCGIHDEEDLCHRGFKSHRRFIERFCPRYLIHGHVHVYRPDRATHTLYRQTEVINTYGYSVLEIDVPPAAPTPAAAEA